MQTAQIAAYALHREPASQPKRPRGRPRTRTPSYYAALWDEYLEMKNWFESMFGRQAKSDEAIAEALRKTPASLGLLGGQAAAGLLN
jgi:hypothetical protein